LPAGPGKRSRKQSPNPWRYMRMRTRSELAVRVAVFFLVGMAFSFPFFAVEEGKRFKVFRFSVADELFPQGRRQFLHHIGFIGEASFFVGDGSPDAVAQFHGIE